MGVYLGRCDHYDTGTYTSPTKHVIVLKCPNASKTGRQAYRDPRKRASSSSNFGGFIYTLVRGFVGRKVVIKKGYVHTRERIKRKECQHVVYSMIPSIEDRRDACHIPLLLSRSPHFACTCLFYFPIYAISFVFRTPWHQNLLSSQLLGDRTYFQIASTFVRQPIIRFFICLLLRYKVLSAPVRF